MWGALQDLLRRGMGDPLNPNDSSGEAKNDRLDDLKEKSPLLRKVAVKKGAEGEDLIRNRWRKNS